MTSKVFLVNVPPVITMAKVEGWLSRYPPHALKWRQQRQESCVQIETPTMAAANLIACALESLYLPAHSLAVIRGDTEEGASLERLFV